MHPVFSSLFCLLSLLLGCGPLLAAHGVSLDGQLKYPKDFEHFSYTSPLASKGGRLVLHDIGSFDKLNPYTLKGEAPLAIDPLLFEPLAVASLDEPFSQYGLLANDIEVAEDHHSVVFTLNPEARFSDGSPVLAEDVAYSLEMLKSDQVHPHYNYYYQDIKEAEILGERKIRFSFARTNRELHLIAAQIRILSKKHHEQNGFASGGGLHIPLASGPYLISDVNPGRSITYRRNPHYWAKDHPVRKNMFNYDEITVKYYKDQTVALEAFKAGEFDFISINIAKQWARDMEGRRFADGSIIKKSFPHHNNAGIQGFVMNTRKEIFQDRRVRQALGLALDFEWINSSLFHDQYTRSSSFFSNSPLAASGLPEGLELSYLEPFREVLPSEVFTRPPTPVKTDGPAGLRENLLKARELLAAAGWEIKDGTLVNSSGQEFRFEILLVSASFERVMAAYVKNLQRLGIQASYRTIDTALYIDRVKKFDFDMIVTSYGQSQSPGNEQRNYWHSSAAARPGSNNYAGINSAPVDALVERIIYATTSEELTAACKALDRVLWYGYYLVPNWYLPVHRLSYHDKFAFPAELPLYYDPFHLLMTWWLK
ncbi:MAG: extracellular solute-binding protein [Desulforhopalus sp.]|jgi:microcin C transport system substrate-binding protein|nr:extracellular solute-binding protein [Desulforhopalus sp.]